MKNLLLPLFGALSLIYSCSTSTITKTQIYKSYDITFTPKEIEKKINNNLSITIEPIDARKLNDEIFLNTLLDGSYSKEEAYSFYKFINNVDINNKDQKKVIDILSDLYNQLDDLADQNNIENDVKNLFKEKLFQYYALENTNFGQDGAEDLSISKDNLGNINPYNNNNKYLSLFKVKFDNRSNDINDIKLSNFQVISKNELLNPFKIEYFENLHANNDEKIKIIYRMNMPENLRLVNNHSIIKYFSTPPINPSNETLVVNYLDKSVQDFKFDVKIDQINKEILYDKYLIKEPNTEYKHFHIVRNHQNILLLKNNNIFIDRSKENENLKIYSLSVNRFKTKMTLSVKDITPSHFNNKKILIK